MHQTRLKYYRRICSETLVIDKFPYLINKKKKIEVAITRSGIPKKKLTFLSTAPL